MKYLLLICGDESAAAHAQAKLPEAAAAMPDRMTEYRDAHSVRDDRLMLIFTCCHPRWRSRRRSRSPCARSPV